MNINLLKRHPKNICIYGNDNIGDLAEKIKETGWIKPLIITNKNVIISGHRRYNACMFLNIQDIPVEIKEFSNEQEELEALLLENMYRDKTMEQKVKEAKIWETIEKEKAEKRRLSTLKQNTEVENFPQREEQQGKTRDIVAKQVGIGSGKTLESAKIVVKKIDELRESGDMESADFLSSALDRSVSGAKKLAEDNVAKEVPNVYKGMVKDGIITVSEAYDVGKLVIENRKKEKENQKQYEETLTKNDEKQRLEEIEASLPANAVVLDKFRKPEETHIFGITDFKNLTEEQYEKCMKHCKKYQDAIHKVVMLYSELDSIRAWDCVLESQEEVELELETLDSALQNLNKIRNYFKGVRKNKKSNFNEES